MQFPGDPFALRVPHLQAATHLRGVFYGEAGRALAVAGTVERLHGGTVGVPAGLLERQGEPASA